MTKPYPSARRELRQAESEVWHRDTYAQGWTPPKPRLTPLRAFLLLVWALIVANGIGAVIGFWWRP